MSRLKRFTVGTSIMLGLLGVLGVWYQSHYVAPLAPLPPQSLPMPNGYDTLLETLRLQQGPPRWVPGEGWDKQPLSERRNLLVPNEPFLAKTREALTQEYLTPRRTPRIPDNGNTEFLNLHLGQLLFMAQTYGDSGNLPEAMRCAVDSLELGAVVPRGGAFDARDAGFYYEAYGQQVAWKLAGRIDAKTAREAIARLERMEVRRWPLPESLREELRVERVADTLSKFKEGPIYAWEIIRLHQVEEAKETKQHKGENSTKSSAFWNRVKEVYNGPRSIVEASENSMKQAQERFNTPWQSDRLRLHFGTPATSYTDDLYSALELMEYFYRTQSVLLRTHLALRANYLEHGSYPKSLNTLVEAEYLKAVPIDPFSLTRAPLHYRLSGTGFTLWSVGPDTIDDGGRASLAKPGQKTGRFFSSDVVGGDDTILEVSDIL